ncbi:VOC family protein [Arthrobacter polaris]|uniref:VOC family protein n=1 Tax=Arthrobacter polaris TaxID=2813727 RepID=UPI001F464680|nr:VOC family protein [Arthrobacter polaris]UIK88106.1 VOC family protein [Arthrobacter polaris]
MKNFILAASNPTWHDAIMAINTNSIHHIHHIHVSVTDIERSRAYYEGLFGWPIAFEMPADTRKAKTRYAFLYGGVIDNMGHGLLGLRPVSADSFDEERTGLNHLSLSDAPETTYL